MLVLSLDDQVLGPRDDTLYALINLGPHIDILAGKDTKDVRTIVEPALLTFAESAFAKTWDGDFTTLYVDVVTVTKVDSYGQPDYASALRNGSIEFEYAEGTATVATSALHFAGFAEIHRPV